MSGTVLGVGDRAEEKVNESGGFMSQGDRQLD